MNPLYTFYVLYFLISVAVIHLTARILSKTSLSYLVEAFHGNSELALLIDRVILASFFLANVGFVVSNVPYWTTQDHFTPRDALTTLLDKLGSAMLFDGFTLFLGLWLFARLRRLGEPAAVTR